MKIDKLIEELLALKQQGFSEVILNDSDSGVIEDFSVKVESVSGGEVISEAIIDNLRYEALDVEDYREDYEDGDYWKACYPTFEDFYNFLENDRVSQVLKYDNSKATVVISHGY